MWKWDWNEGPRGIGDRLDAYDLEFHQRVRQGITCLQRRNQNAG
jgi:hypothetical protein